MAQLVINVGDPQPVECPSCKNKYGYQFSDHIKLHYTSCFTEEGKEDGGVYSDGYRTINHAATAYCANCTTKLPFKLKRVKKF